ncbi:kinetoplast-associated protein, partial [Trypanosoma theileri]
MPPRRHRRHASAGVAEAMPKAKTQEQQQQQQPEETPKVEMQDVKTAEIVAPKVVPVEPIPPPPPQVAADANTPANTTVLQENSTAEMQMSAVPTSTVQTETTRSVVTKLAKKRKPKLSFLFEEEGQDVDDAKRKPKLAFLFDEDASRDKDLEKEPPQHVQNSVSNIEKVIEEVNKSSIENKAEEVDTTSEKPVVKVESSRPIRRAMEYSKRAKQRHKEQKIIDNQDDNTEANKVTNESNIDENVLLNSTNTTTQLKDNQEDNQHIIEREKVALSSPSVIDPVESKENQRKLHDTKMQISNEVPNKNGARHVNVMITKPLKRNRHFHTIEKEVTKDVLSSSKPVSEGELGVSTDSDINSVTEQTAPVKDNIDQPQLSHSSSETKLENGNTMTRKMSKLSKLAKRKKIKRHLGVEKLLNEESESNTMKAEEEATRKRAEEEAARKKAEEEAARKKAEEESARKKAEEEAARKKAEEEAARKKAEEEAARKKAEEEAARKKAEEEAARKKAE